MITNGKLCIISSVEYKDNQVADYSIRSRVKSGLVPIFLGLASSS